MDRRGHRVIRFFFSVAFAGLCTSPVTRAQEEPAIIFSEDPPPPEKKPPEPAPPPPQAEPQPQAQPQPEPPPPAPAPPPESAPEPEPDPHRSVLFKPWAPDWRPGISIDLGRYRCKRLPCKLALSPGAYDALIRSDGEIAEIESLNIEYSTRTVRVRPLRSGRIAYAALSAASATLMLTGVICAAARNDGGFNVAGALLLLAATPSFVVFTINAEARRPKHWTSNNAAEVGIGPIPGGAGLAANVRF